MKHERPCPGLFHFLTPGAQDLSQAIKIERLYGVYVGVRTSAWGHVVGRFVGVLRVFGLDKLHGLPFTMRPCS